jgi:hypothetical protein
MQRTIAIVVVLLAAGCIEPPKTNRALVYVSGLQDLTTWDPVNGGRGNESYEGILGLPPPDNVPVLIAYLLDPTPTKIYDRLHDPPTVGDVVFHMLLLLFSMRAEDFASEGVWISKSEQIRKPNPIYFVRIEKDSVREKLRERFARMAMERGWYGDQKPEKPK